MKNLKFAMLFGVLAFSSCIEQDIIDDAVPEEVRITNDVSALKIGETLVLEASYFNNVGEIENRTLSWQSSDETVLSINASTATATAKTEGTATIMVTVNGILGTLTDHKIITVTQNDAMMSNAKKGTFMTTSSYKAAGDFEITSTTNGIKIELASNYVADTSLPGFALFLTNNPNSLANALQIDAYDDADGAHYTGAFTYNVSNVGLNDYKYLVQWCRPFSILTGKALITDK
ncbi:hypothetical protein [Polaribacter sp.]|uniref:hypothetical protein n=1 Tax=Polaribacter sp. TaxID=1920175 RepID=UPI0040475855